MSVKSIDRFLLRDILSDGSAGTVYRAEETLPGNNTRPVALKVLPLINPKDTATTDRFFNEVKVLAQLAVHPHVVTIYAMGLTDNYPWLAMEHADATLAARITENGADPSEITKLLEQIAKGLAAMHALKPPLIHQDLKPANILIDAVGNYKITDFSLATVVAANRTHGVATVRYAAPELLTSEFGKVGPATDLYALGHIAYELALGSRNHIKQFPAVFEGNAAKEPPPNKWMMWHASIATKPLAIADIRKDFPQTLSAIIEKLMAKPPTLRYASAPDLLADLASLHTAPAPIAPPPRAAAASATASASASTYAVSPASPSPGQPPTAPTPTTTPPSDPIPTGPTTRYWVRARGKVSGPYDFPTLQRQAKANTVSRFHQISTDQTTWKPITDIEGLYGPTVV